MVGEVPVCAANDAMPDGSAAPTYTPCWSVVTGGVEVGGLVVVVVVGSGAVAVVVVVVGSGAVAVVAASAGVGWAPPSAGGGGPKKVAEPLVVTTP